MDPKNMNPEIGMNMMKRMMGGDDGNPMQMCKDMIATVKQTSQMTAFSTQELHSLFNDWLDTIKQDVLRAINKSASGELNEVAKLLGLSTESTAYLLARMAIKEELILQAKSTPANRKAKAKKKAAKKKTTSSASKKKPARKKRT